MCGVLDVDAEMTGTLTLGYRDAVAVTDSALAPLGTRVHGHEFHRTAIRPPTAGATPHPIPTNPTLNPTSIGATSNPTAPISAPNAWRWRARHGVVTEGFVQGGVHASYLHTHWMGLPGAADRIVAAARSW